MSAIERGYTVLHICYLTLKTFLPQKNNISTVKAKIKREESILKMNAEKRTYVGRLIQKLTQKLYLAMCRIEQPSVAFRRGYK